jgi:hypothetical protein
MTAAEEEFDEAPAAVSSPSVAGGLAMASIVRRLREMLPPEKEKNQIFKFKNKFQDLFTFCNNHVLDAVL